MSFLGKNYKCVNEENFEPFIKALGLPEEFSTKIAQYKPEQKFEKDGDSYKHTIKTPNREKVIPFKSGVSFNEKLRDIVPVKITYTVDGETVTQVIVDDDGRSATFKMEYTGDTMKVTITATFWNGTAYRYYSAA